jgi:uncharacterized protein DUF6166
MPGQGVPTLALAWALSDRLGLFHYFKLRRPFQVYGRVPLSACGMLEGKTPCRKSGAASIMHRCRWQRCSVAQSDASGKPPMPRVERYYSGKASGEVAVREGGATRVLEPCPEVNEQERRPFTWGREQAGAAHLAFALLKDACNDAVARRFYQQFSRRVVANFPERWTITGNRITAHVEMMKYERDHA